MKIVDRKAFFALPAGTLFSKYEPCVFGDLSIKGETICDIDFCVQQIANAVRCDDSGEFFNVLDRARETGKSFALDFDCEGRDGLFEKDQLFAVWEPSDVDALIDRLRAVREAFGR